MQDIAERCGVCKQTVSRAFRGDRKVSKQKTDEILAVAKDLGYDISLQHAARRMALQKHGLGLLDQIIAFVCRPGPTPDQYLSQFVWAAWDAVTSRGYGLLLLDHSREWPPSVRRGEIDGAILFDLSADGIGEQAIGALRGETMFGQRPIVSLVASFAGCSSVTQNDRLGARLAAGHLLDLGHRRIVHFHGSELKDQLSLDRQTGYRESCEERGLDPDECLISTLWTVAPKETSYPITVANLVELLKQRREITAVLARQDEFASELIAGMERAGFRVPEDISVVGYDDNIPYPDSYGANMLTTVHSPLREIGDEAAQLALKLVAGDWGSLEHIVLQPYLVVRKSTTRPRLSL